MPTPVWKPLALVPASGPVAGVVWVTISMALFGALAAFARGAMNAGLHPFEVVFLRNLFAVLMLVPLLPTGFVPPSDRAQTQINLELPPGSTLAETRAVAEQARADQAPETAAQHHAASHEAERARRLEQRSRQLGRSHAHLPKCSPRRRSRYAAGP